MDTFDLLLNYKYIGMQLEVAARYVEIHSSLFVFPVSSLYHPVHHVVHDMCNVRHPLEYRTIGWSRHRTFWQPSDLAWQSGAKEVHEDEDVSERRRIQYLH